MKVKQQIVLNRWILDFNLIKVKISEFASPFNILIFFIEFF